MFFQFQKNYSDFLIFDLCFGFLFLLGLLQLFSWRGIRLRVGCCICDTRQPSWIGLWGLLLCLALLRGRWLLLERACTNGMRHPIR